MIERNIDYLQFSTLLNESELIERGFEKVSAPKFYKRGYADETGFRYFYGNPNSKSCLIVASGAALHNARASGRNDQFILNWAIEGQGKITRLDLSVTDWIDESLVLVSDVENWFKRGKITSSYCADGAKIISSVEPEHENTPQTLYIGSMEKRGKRGIFRAYDKGIELNIGKYMATRLEIEMRGDNAHNTAKRIAKNGDISGNFRAKLNVKDKEFDRLMDAPMADISRGKAEEKESIEDKMAKRWTWLTETVAPSLKEAFEFDKKRWNSDDRMYFFLREAGFSHAKIVQFLDLRDKTGDNKINRSLRNDQ